MQPASLGAIAGEPETFKSLLAVEIACKIEAGGLVLSRFPVDLRGPVGYVWQDDSEANELDRVQRYAKAHGLAGPGHRIAWYLNPGLTLPDGLPTLRREVERHGFSLLVLDSFYNFLPELDLRSEDVLPIVNGLKALADETGAAVLVVDHAPKPSENTRGRRANLTPYGSVFKAAAFRWGLYTEGNADGIRLSAASNNGPPALTRELVVFDGDAYELRLIERPGARDLLADVADFLAEHPGSPTSEIAAGVSARVEAVRELLQTDGSFMQVPTPSGRPANARCWALAEALVPQPGTSGDEDTGGQPSLLDPEPPTPFRGWAPDERGESPRPAPPDEGPEA